MSPSARKILVALSTGLLVGLLTACSKQGEGERCDSSKAGDSDCEDGLVCANLNLDPKGEPLERCCPPQGAPISDDRCNPTNVPPPGAGGSSNGGNAASDAGAGGDPAMGGTGGTAGTAGTGGDSTPSDGGTDASSGAGGA